MKALVAAALLLVAVPVATPAHADLTPDEDAPVNRPAVDPFRTLVAEPEPVKAVVIDPGPKITPIEVKPVVLPVSFRVDALAVDGPHRVAVVDYEGQSYIVQEGTSVPDNAAPAFTVKALTDTQVTVFDARALKLVSKQISE